MQPTLFDAILLALSPTPFNGFFLCKSSKINQRSHDHAIICSHNKKKFHRTTATVKDQRYELQAEISKAVAKQQ